LGFQFISLYSDNKKSYKIKIHPSKASKRRLIDSIKEIIQKNLSASSYNLISLLSPKIIGWANYFCILECVQDFSKIDYIIYNQIRAWVFRRKSKGLRFRTKLVEKYFSPGKIFVFRGKEYSNNWVLKGQILIKGNMKENFLPQITWVKSKQHVKVKGNASPYDGNHLYWAMRTEKYSGYTHRVSTLIKRQYGQCAICKEYFTPLDIIETYHIVPRSEGGSDKYINLQVLHKHCHVQKSFRDSSVSMNQDIDIQVTES